VSLAGRIGAEVGVLPPKHVLAQLRSGFEATAHDDVHNAFMTLPPYTRTREREVP